MPHCRPFKLIDVTIMIATAAFGIAEMRPQWIRFQKLAMDNPNGTPWQFYAGPIQIGLSMALLNLAIAYFWIRLIPPCLPRSDLIRQPGMLFLLLMLGLSIPLLALSPFVPLVSSTNQIFAVVLGLSWSVACRRYRSRAEPGWIEGLGRFFGLGLVVAIAAG